MSQASRLLLVLLWTVGGLACPDGLAAQEVRTAVPLTVSRDLNITGSGNGLWFPDGSFQASAATVYARTVLVSPEGTPAANGAALLAALAAVTGATESAPCLLKIEPGVFDLGAQWLEMKPWVDVEGAGEGVTRVVGGVDAPQRGVVVACSHAELRWLTVENRGPGNICPAVYVGAGTPALTRITACASGGAYNVGILVTAGAAPVIRHVTAAATGPAVTNKGIDILGAQPLVFDTTAESSGGNSSYAVHSTGSAGVFQDLAVRVSGGSHVYGVYAHQGTPVLNGVRVVVAQGAVENFGIFLLDADTQVTGADVQVAEGFEKYGVYVARGAARFTNLAVRVSGEGGNRAFYNSEEARTEVLQARVSAAGGTANYGVYNANASLRLQAVEAAAQGTHAEGLHMGLEGGSLEATQCLFRGATAALWCAADNTALLGACKLDGPVAGPGAIGCARCYDGVYTGLDADCQ